jgi:hypothetical protein
MSMSWEEALQASIEKWDRLAELLAADDVGRFRDVLMDGCGMCAKAQSELEALSQLFRGLTEYPPFKIAWRSKDRFCLGNDYLSLISPPELLQQDVQDQGVSNSAGRVRVARDQVRLDHDLVPTLGSLRYFQEIESLSTSPAIFVVGVNDHTVAELQLADQGDPAFQKILHPV